MIDQLLDQTKARLEALGIFNDHLTAADIAGIEEVQQQTPAVSIIYGGLQITDNAQNGKAAKVSDRVGIVITERFNEYDAATLYARTAPLIEQTIAHLMGWTPDGYTNHLTLAGAPEPLFTQEGFAYFPLEFDIARVIKAS
jgi:hypothetical protein